jgi:hypothetical protein
LYAAERPLYRIRAVVGWNGAAPRICYGNYFTKQINLAPTDLPHLIHILLTKLDNLGVKLMRYSHGRSRRWLGEQGRRVSLFVVSFQSGSQRWKLLAPEHIPPPPTALNINLGSDRFSMFNKKGGTSR